MFFFFGWNNQKLMDLGKAIQQTKCLNCNNTTNFHFIKIIKRFELFFVPVFPYNIKYFFLCPICNQGLEIEDKKIIKEIKND